MPSSPSAGYETTSRTAWNASSGTTTERYAYDGWDTAKPDPVGGEAFDAWIDLDGTNAVTARRLFGPGFDDPLARQDAAGNVAWYGADHLGSVRTVFDNAGTITGARDYAGFGAITAASGSGLDRYAFAGMSWDPTLGLSGTPSGGRWYDAAAGRWTAEDPLGADPSNPYRYVGNAPTTATDPSGLKPGDPVRIFWGQDKNGNQTWLEYTEDWRALTGSGPQGPPHYTLQGVYVQIKGQWYVARYIDGHWRIVSTDAKRRGGKSVDEAFRSGEYHGSLIGGLPGMKSGLPGLVDIVDIPFQRPADVPTASQPGVTVGVGAGIAAATIIAMMEYVAAELAEQLVLKYTGTKLLQFLHHIGSRGWKVILDRRTGKVVKVLTEDGKPVARGDWEAAVKEFETAQERKALPPHTPKEAAPPGNAEPCPPAGKGATTPGKPVPKHVRDPNWKPTWSLEKRTRNVDILTENMGIGPIEKDGRAAHHIVQATNNKDPSFQKARDLLLEHQIDINSSANGVALQSTKPGARVNPGLRRHAGGDLHTKVGGQRTLKRLEEAVERAGSDWGARRQALLDALDEMRQGILAGTFP